MSYSGQFRDENNLRYLNAFCQPPSNLKIRQATDSLFHAAVYETDPKPHWQASIEDIRALAVHYLNAPPFLISSSRNLRSKVPAPSSILHLFCGSYNTWDDIVGLAKVLRQDLNS
ncbi:hypothetical protein QM012_005068 [Aureobasidium pullulans]|uniref:PLP-dependent transferase n=1 Tax=Aureobasidium pullulans TaxID=5580 RepID=A0ABR0T7I5_AURPU